MTNISLNISGKIDPHAVAVYQAVSVAADQLEIPIVVVGASARDLVLHYGHGASIQRATTDVDFGIQVADWQAFAALKTMLISKGFQASQTQHRIASPHDLQVDLVPFGQLEDADANIQWPHDGDRIMSVLGFDEACADAEIVCIQSDPAVNIPVATPKGMVLLKLIAWMDRARELRSKDAKDFTYLLKTYEKIKAINDHLYEDQQLMEQYAWDIERAAAHQLGEHSAAIASEKTHAAIVELLSDRRKSLSTQRLIEEMCEQIESDYQRNELLLSAFKAGYATKL